MALLVMDGIVAIFTNYEMQRKILYTIKNNIQYKDGRKLIYLTKGESLYYLKYIILIAFAVIGLILGKYFMVGVLCTLEILDIYLTIKTLP